MRRSAERNSHPNDTRILKEKEFGWKNTDSLNSIPPNEFTISHINQHHDMLVSQENFFLDFFLLSTKIYLGSFCDLIWKLIFFYFVC